MSAPIADPEFSECMTSLGPFEACPHIAVAVSGGADSLSLTLLLDRWARARGGEITALTVDHGLRPEAADEAAAVTAKLTRHGIRHETLRWIGRKPAHGIQAGARRARYGLLEDWCARTGVLHLAVAHHAGDQAETFMMRLAKGSGPDGLAAMAPVREMTHCRLMRPLLGFSKSRLEATAAAAGMTWAHDPSNDDRGFERIRWRQALVGAGIDGADLVRGIERFAAVRQALDAQTAEWMARYVRLDPAGFAVLAAGALAAPDEIRHRALGRLAAAIGGRAYQPARAAVERLAASLATGKGATLAGARFTVSSLGDIGIYREARNRPATQSLRPGEMVWDGRFRVSVAAAADEISALAWTDEAAAEWRKFGVPSWFAALPAGARPGLFVLRRKNAMIVPQPGGPETVGVRVEFRPSMPLTGPGFSVA